MVDANLGRINEIRKEWTLGQYLDAFRFLAMKQAAEKKAMEQAKSKG